jgi:hypothetical protein
LKSLIVSLPIKGCDNIHSLHRDDDEPKKRVRCRSQRDNIIGEYVQFERSPFLSHGYVRPES